MYYLAPLVWVAVLQLPLAARVVQTLGDHLISDGFITQQSAWNKKKIIGMFRTAVYIFIFKQNGHVTWQIRVIISWVAAQAVRWSGVPADAYSNPGCCIKSYDLSAVFTPCNTCKHAHEGVILPTRVGGATSQLDLQSLAPLSVAACGRLQPGVPNLVTSSYYFK